MHPVLHPSTLRRWGAAVAIIAVVGACGGSSSPSPSASPSGPSPSPSEAAGPIPLVIDNDMSFDDVMAIAYLTTQPDVEILGITVTGTGIARCGPGARNARNLMNELGAPPVPTACGTEEPIAGGEVFPADWRDRSDAMFGLVLEGIPGTPKGTAVDLLTELVGGSDRPVTILATGPLTNVAQALAADPTLADGIERIVIMGGAVDVAGNATSDGSPAAAEWNFAADPAAAAAVFAAGIPITLVPLDATNDVMITRAFADELHSDATAGPANLVDELLLRNSMSVDMDYFWDVVAAMWLIEPAVVTTEEATIAVDTEDQVAGRTRRADGGATVTLATGTDTEAFEAAFLEALRSGGPRRSTFEIAGEIAMTFDGTTCAAQVPAAPVAGSYMFLAENRSELDSVVVATQLVEGATFADLDAWFAANPGSTDQPPMIEIAGLTFLGPGRSGTFLAELGPGGTGLACLIASTGKEAVVSGPRFEVE